MYNSGGVDTTYATGKYQQNQQSRPKKTRPRSAESGLLTKEENEALIAALGNDCISLATAVCQLLRADSQRRWMKILTGVCTLVKDYNRRAYVIRVYDVKSMTVAWEQVLYKLFRVSYNLQDPRFMSFEGDKAVYGLNFAAEYEARTVHFHFQKRYEQETRSHKSQPPAPAYNRTLPKATTTGITSVGAVSHVSSVKHLEESSKKVKKSNKKKDKKPKIRKEDIGNPINFQHKAHIGWNQDGGFNQQVYDAEPMDDSVRDLLRAAGQDPDNLKPEDLKFVYSFLDDWNAGKSTTPPVVPPSPVVTSIQKVPPPPTPSYNNRLISAPIESRTEPRHNRPLPQLPPAHSSHNTPQIPRHEHMPSRPPPPPPPPAPSNYHQNAPALPSNRTASLMPSTPQFSSAPPAPPPPPAEIFKSTSAPPPPPPPPPPPGALQPKPESNLPKSTGARANLLAEIHAGAKLKHVAPPPEKSPAGLGKVANGNGTGNARDDMMNAIKQGATLRHVDQAEVAENRKSAVATQDLDGIAGALARALESRRNKMMAPSDSEEDDNDSDWEDD